MADSTFALSMLAKPFVGLVLIALFYFLVIKSLRWLYPRLPKNRLVDALFRERVKGRAPDYGPGFGGSSKDMTPRAPARDKAPPA